MSARPFSLDAPASPPKERLRLRWAMLLIVAGCFVLTVFGSYLLEMPEWRMILLGAITTLAGFLVLTVAAVWMLERLRRRRADRQGFQQFVQAGGPHSFPALFDAFQGITPEHRFLQPPPCRAEVVRVGSLTIGSGAIVVADPAFLPFNEDLGAAFDENAPAGEWPVTAVILHYADGSRQIGALRVQWSEAAHEHLVLAWRPNSRIAAAETRKLPRIAIDSGIACLGTAEARDAFNQRPPAGFWQLATRAFPVAQVRFARGMNLIACRSGAGEGDYVCFFGRDAEGRSTGLYIDFGLIGVAQRMGLPSLPREPQRHLHPAAGSCGISQPE